LPAKKTDSTIKTKTNRVANAGIYVSGGSIEQSDFDKAEYRELMQDYTDMRNNDSIASTSIDILIYPILNSKFTINAGYKEGEKPTPLAIEASQYVQETFNLLDSGLKYYMRHKLLALYFGFAMFEKVWKMGQDINGKIGNRLYDMYPIQHDTIWWFKYDEKCNFTGIKQEQRQPEKGFKHIDIDAEYLHVYTPFEEFKNIQGRSLLRPSRLVWKIKKQVWLASGRGASRGAGIPEFKITPTGDDTKDLALKSTLQTIAKNVGNSENAYVITQTDAVEFTLHSLQNQESNLPLIQQANTEMFYNTLSEFVTSGIGGNGSRAATGEHKSPYYDGLDAIVGTFEDNEDKLIKEIVDNSPYAGKLELYEMPYCTLEMKKDSDIVAVGNLINSMVGRSLTKSPDLEVFLRNMLGLPEKTEEEIEQIKEENTPDQLQPENNNEEVTKDGMQEEKPNPTEEVTEEGTKELYKDCNHELGLVVNNSIVPDDIFEETNAILVMQQANAKAEAIITDVYTKLIEDIAIKLERNPGLEIKIPFKKELIDRLSKVYNEAYKPGQQDIRKEYAKIAGTQLANLTPIVIEGNKDRLIAKVSTLYSAIENSIKDELLLVNKQNIENAGGMRQYITDRFSQTQKQIRSDLSSITSGGYLAGRNDQLAELETKDSELKRLYLNNLEGYEKVCDICRPLNMMTMSREEAEGVGLNFDGSPVNPLCMGGNNCKCTWRPAYHITDKGGF